MHTNPDAHMLLLLLSAASQTANEVGAAKAAQRSADNRLAAARAEALWNAVMHGQHDTAQSLRSRRLQQAVVNQDNVTIVRTNTSAVGTFFDDYWEIGWPGKNPSCNGYVLYTVGCLFCVCMVVGGGDGDVSRQCVSVLRL